MSKWIFALLFFVFLSSWQAVAIEDDSSQIMMQPREREFHGEDRGLPRGGGAIADAGHCGQREFR